MGFTPTEDKGTISLGYVQSIPSKSGQIIILHQPSLGLPWNFKGISLTKPITSGAQVVLTTGARHDPRL